MIYSLQWSKLKKEMVEKVEKKKSEIEIVENEIKALKEESSVIPGRKPSCINSEFQYSRNNLYLENKNVLPSKGFNRGETTNLQGFNSNRDPYFSQNQHQRIDNHGQSFQLNEYWQSKTNISYVSPNKSFGERQQNSFVKTNMPTTDNDRRHIHGQSNLSHSTNIRPKQDGILSLGDGLLPPPRPIFQKESIFHKNSSFRSPEPTYFKQNRDQHMPQDKDARNYVSSSFQQQPLLKTPQINMQMQGQSQHESFKNNININKHSSSVHQTLQPHVIQNNFQIHQKHQRSHEDINFNHNIHSNTHKAQFSSDRLSLNKFRPSYNMDLSNDSFRKNENLISGPKMDRHFIQINKDRDSQYRFDEDRRDNQANHADDRSFRNFSDRIRNISQQRRNG